MTGTPKIKWLEKVTVVNTGSKAAPAVDSTTLSFNAGAADKLVVIVSSERTWGAVPVVTYNGVALTWIPGGYVAGGSERFSGFFYLDNPYTGGAATLSVDFSDGGYQVNGLGIGVISLAGTSVGYGAVAANLSTSVSIATLLPNSAVIAGFGGNGTGAVSAAAPLTSIYASTDIGSARAAAGYVLVAAPTTSINCSFTTTAANPSTGAVVFPPRWRQAA